MPVILIVEDEPQIRAMLAETLHQEGYATRVAAHGEEALVMSREQAPDLVITDILMPGKEGLSLIKELRRERPALPIIAISGGAAMLTPGCNLELARMFGAAYTFEKPLDIEALLAAIAGCLGA